MAAPRNRPGKVLAEPLSREVILAQYSAVLEEIPFAEDDGGLSIIANILTATTWEELNRENELDNLQDFVGKRVKVIKLERRISDIEGGMPWYLMVDAIDADTGELVKINTSAGSPMAKLAMLHHFGNLPALVKVTKAEKATKAGFFPLDVDVLMVDQQEKSA